ncbi:hypothetical protein C9J44_14030 [Photobacterium sp. GB-27]|uniref:sel1 repeat family protein n=1 Tax=unclassified Photobacterium TaxID=2628852 RepID=UPI000D17A764|nr:MULTISPECIES: sel1 repeat family protein [unclassified Photobacterium]PSV31147.1 hypothetical protein C9J38_21360 [Photobacterium sp. GB-210]PSV34904.1 hypothetical protein C9J44_14030 [Photobacterium sp. GB-27]
MKVTITTLLLVFSFLVLNGCSKATTPQQADIAVFEQFLSENPISSVSPTVDIASIYQQGDPLFESVLYIQRNLWAEAKKQLEPMAKNQNPDAKFWLASITWGTGIKNNPIAKKLYMESAEQGNPYAALFFSPKNDICQMYYSSECSEKWVEKAQKLFAEQAKTGNVRAVYYSTILKPDLTHEEYIDAVIQSAEKHYYYPLVEYANKIINEDKPNKNMEAMAVNLLNYAQFNNFIPAIDALMGYEGEKKRTQGEQYKSLTEQGINIGSNHAWRVYLLNSINDKSLSSQQKYFIAKASELFNGYDYGISFSIPPKGKAALIAANKKAQEKADSVKRVIYIDGAHVPEG